MTEMERIRGVIAAVRRRLLWRAAIETAGFGAAALAIALLALAGIALWIGPAGFWPTVTSAMAMLFVLVALTYGVLRPARALRDENAAARRLGAMVPPLASDLISAVELDAAVAGTGAGGAAAAARAPVSAVLVRAFQAEVARALAPVEPRALVPLRPASLAVAAFAAAAALMGVAAWLSPALASGLRTLVHRPSLFEGAAVSATPLVGDVRIVYQYPAYTGLAPRIVEGSTGDLVAVKGTHVRIETRALRSARKALLLLGEQGERGTLGATVANGLISAELTLVESGSYRFWLEPMLGRAVREEQSHRIAAEADTPPRVEILGPADHLELANPRPIEVGYSASDDYGLGAVELVYRVGDRPEQRQLLRDARGARTAEGRTLWDPAQAGLASGERIAYRIEARDRDEVSGAKVGSSRTLYVVIQNPHESLDDRLDRQRELLEKLVADLADRLEQDTSAAPAARVAALGTVHEAEESHLALLGRLIDDDRREGTLSKALRATLGGIADRLERLLRDEAKALGALRAKASGAKASGEKASGETAGGPLLASLDGMQAKHAAELEKDVLLIDDLIGRQRLEDLASLGRELTDAHQRLQDLLERYKASKDEALRRQLEREARELRARIADLAQKISALKARNEVPEEWRNMPDMKGLMDEARKFDELLEKGDVNELGQALSQLGNDIKDLKKMLDENLEGFGAERFPQENRVVAEMMKKIGDLEGDERTLQRETQGLSEKQEAEIERRLKGQLDEFLKREDEKVERLRQRLAGVATGDPESALSDDIERARESAKQMKRLLGEHDMAEAKGEAERAAGSLDRAADHLGEEAEGRRGRGRHPTEAERDKNAEAVAESRGMAQEIAEDLAKLLPRASDTLTPAEREQARQQSERQGSIGNRTDETADEAARRLGKMPGLEKAEADLKAAASRMRQAAEMLKRSESKQAAGAERDAADRLAKLRDSMQERSMGSSKQHHDPVRIPGADESSAPRAWRQELLDAMKEKAPERFREEVRRYYEELIK
jgi:hypothetical protein